jgi:hypothetical protein
MIATVGILETLESRVVDENLSRKLNLMRGALVVSYLNISDIDEFPSFETCSDC